MNSIETKRKYEECITQAKEVLGHIVPDIEVMYHHDPIVRTVTLHLAQMYFLIKTNEHFQKESEDIDIRIKQMLEGLKLYPTELRKLQ